MPKPTAEETEQLLKDLKGVVDAVKGYGYEPIQNVLRTPDERFANLHDFPFKPNYIVSHAHLTAQGEGLRIHYVDEGPRDGEVILLMHGEPTWSYLYRKMIPILVDAGFRVVAPDLVGFGRSDKPSRREDFTYARMVDWMADVVTTLKLQNITMFCQDWGGLLGLRLVARFPERFARVAMGNTDLPTGGNLSPMFARWATQLSQMAPGWGMMVESTSTREMTQAEIDAYDAPFPSEEYKAATRVVPQLVPATDGHPAVDANKEARQVLSRFNKPFLTAWGIMDPIIPFDPLGKKWQALVPGAKGQNHQLIENASHFLQEDQGPALAQVLLDFIKANPLAKL